MKSLKQALPDNKFMTVAENVIMNDPSDCSFLPE